MRITRRHLLRDLGLGALALAAGAGSYFAFTKDKATKPISPQPKVPFSIQEGRIDLLERIPVEAALEPLKPRAFATTSGRQGWRVRLPGARPLATPAVSQGSIYL